MGGLELQQCDQSASIPDAVHRGKGCLGIIIGIASGGETDFEAWNAIAGSESYELVDDIFDWRHLG